MAQYRLSIKPYHTAILRRIDYINREGKYKYGKKGEEYVAGWSANLPSWAADERDFWQVIENSEKPGNVQARGFQLNLPVELRTDENIKIVQELMDKWFKDHAYTVAFHNKPGNPHAHIYFSERKIDDRPEPDRNSYCRQRTGYSKDREITGLKRDQWLRRLRKGWEEIQNQALERCGCKEKVSCETLEKRGIKRISQVHLGPVAAALERRGIQTRRGDINRRIKAINKRLDDYAKQISDAYKQVEDCDLQINKEKIDILKLETENNNIRRERRIEEEKHQADIWKFCSYFISDKSKVTELCNRFDKKDYSGFVDLIAQNFCNEYESFKNTPDIGVTEFAKEIYSFASQNQLKLTKKELSKCLSYKFWSLYGSKNKATWQMRYDGYFTYLQFRRTIGGILNERPKKENELESYEKTLKKWDGIANQFVKNGKSPYGDNVDFHEIIGTRLKETQQALKSIKRDKNSITKFANELDRLKKQPMTTRVEVSAHEKLSEKLNAQKDDIINCFNRLKPVSSGFCDGYLAQISSLDKMFESESQRATDALDIIGKEERHDKDCVVKFEENLDLWRKQSLKTREEIQKHEALSKDLLEAKNDLIIAFDRLKVNAPEFTSEHERVLSIDKTLEEDSKRVEDALNAIKQAEQAEEEQRLKDEAEQKATQERLRLAAEAAAREEQTKRAKDKKLADEEKRQVEHKEVEILSQLQPRSSIAGIVVWGDAVLITRICEQPKQYEANQMQDLLDNYGLDVKEYSDQHPRKVSYLQQIIDIRDKYQRDHPPKTVEKEKAQEVPVHQAENVPKQSADRRKIRSVMWGMMYRKDRPRVLFVQWSDNSQPSAYRANQFEKLFEEHRDDIKEYYEKSDNEKLRSNGFNSFRTEMQKQIGVWKDNQPQQQNGLSIPSKDPTIGGR